MNNEIFNVETITGKANSTIVKIGKLSSKKYRYEDKLFVCNGIKLFLEASRFNAKIRYIVVKNSINFEENVVEADRLMHHKIHILESNQCSKTGDISITPPTFKTSINFENLLFKYKISAISFLVIIGLSNKRFNNIV